MSVNVAPALREALPSQHRSTVSGPEEIDEEIRCLVCGRCAVRHRTELRCEIATFFAPQLFRTNETFRSSGICFVTFGPGFFLKESRS